jgi:hypothetical protein
VHTSTRFFTGQGAYRDNVPVIEAEREHQRRSLVNPGQELSFKRHLHGLHRQPPTLDV